ncbi:hypothetical protein [Sphingomonas sp. LHG3406-1]|uniref:hypothetical protein n=1 Tax=Sphingomonas sp. LHG3406-1 TaxID=2804617 RepID=UPI00261179E5|nr:hypothetical protein [Sphingomonas sp. LHG3406-1]
MLREPLIAPGRPPRLPLRLALLGAWLLLVLWLAAHHVVWRDEARAFAIATSGSSWGEMLRTLHGEGHPALWYLLLRAGHDLFGVREVLPVAGVVVGAAAAALFALRAPFRPLVLALVLFSAFFVMDYTVVARNYGLSALILFTIAACWSRVKDSGWFGLLLFLLANTNVPSLFVAGGLLLYRGLELLEGAPGAGWRRWFINAALLGVGALVCFATVYPPFNDAAVGLGDHAYGPFDVFRALTDVRTMAGDLGIKRKRAWIALLLLAGSLLVFARHRRALVTALVVFVMMKLFFYFIYLAYLRHAALFILFVLALAWIVAAEGKGGAPRRSSAFAAVGGWLLVALLAIQSLTLTRKPLLKTAQGVPYGQAQRLAALMEARPELRQSVLIVDPDMLGEPLVYYRDKPIWLLRQQRFGDFALFSRSGRKVISLDDMLADAAMHHRRTGRPVAIALQLPLDRTEDGVHPVMFQDSTVITAEGRARFLGQTRLVARLRPAQTDEHYDLYVYPR